RLALVRRGPGQLAGHLHVDVLAELAHFQLDGAGAVDTVQCPHVHGHGHHGAGFATFDADRTFSGGGHRAELHGHGDRVGFELLGAGSLGLFQAVLVLVRAVTVTAV